MFAFFFQFSAFLCQFPTLTCPSEISSSFQVTVDCGSSYIFQKQEYAVPMFLQVILKLVRTLWIKSLLLNMIEYIESFRWVWISQHCVCIPSNFTPCPFPCSLPWLHLSAAFSRAVSRGLSKSRCGSITIDFLLNDFLLFLVDFNIIELLLSNTIFFRVCFTQFHLSRLIILKRVMLKRKLELIWFRRLFFLSFFYLSHFLPGYFSNNLSIL